MTLRKNHIVNKAYLHEGASWIQAFLPIDVAEYFIVNILSVEKIQGKLVTLTLLQDRTRVKDVQLMRN